MQTLNTHRLFRCLLATGLLAGNGVGCSQDWSQTTRSKTGQVSAGSAQAAEKYRIDLGTIRTDSAVGHVKINGQTVRKVAKVKLSCGCTATSLQEGDALLPGEHVNISLDLRHKPPGKGEQTLKFHFHDESIVAITLAYNYLPAPTATPQSLVFHGHGAMASIRISQDQRFNSAKLVIDCPEFINAEFSPPGNTERSITFTLTEAEKHIGSNGVIRLTTPLDQDVVLRVPYIVLAN